MAILGSFLICIQNDVTERNSLDEIRSAKQMLQLPWCGRIAAFGITLVYFDQATSTSSEKINIISKYLLADSKLKLWFLYGSSNV